MYSMKQHIPLIINMDAFSCFKLYCQLVSNHSDDPVATTLPLYKAEDIQPEIHDSQVWRRRWPWAP